MMPSPKRSFVWLAAVAAVVPTRWLGSLTLFSVLCAAGCTRAVSVSNEVGPGLPLMAFVGVSVVPMTEAGGVMADQTVLVQHDRILAVGARTTMTVPARAVRIDGTGKYLMPGLADMHVHLEYFEDPAILGLFLANGVTTVRNMDGRPYILVWKRQIAAGKLLGPTIYTAGRLLDGDPPLRSDNTVVRDAAEAQTAVANQKAAGYDFVKVYTNLSLEAYRAILRAAREHDLLVTGHVPRGVSLREVFAGGQAAIEHLGDYDEAIEADDSPFRGRYQWFKRFLGMPMDQAKAATIALEQARARVWTVPTLIQAEREIAPPELVHEWLASPEMAYVQADGREFWEEQSREAAERMDAEDWKLIARGRINRLALVRTLHQAGVPLLVGTDTPNPFVIPGFSLHQELGSFTDTGLSADVALAASTREAADFLGELDTWGTVERGKRADLLLLDANPLDSIASVRALAGVMVRGRWLPRDELTRMLAALRQPKTSDERKSAFGLVPSSVSSAINEAAASRDRFAGVSRNTALRGESRR
jgi:imidazolonepropionase-like amidohydrolase